VAAVTASPIAPNLRVRVCADLFSLVFIVFPFLFSVVFVFFQPVFWQPAAKIMAVQG
jgi:TRAP-type mannitol/chloroaromatic compound transport system permease small subunit